MRRADRRLAGQRVWLIGASSGIGAALARALTDRGARTAISARRSALLEQVSQGRMTVVPLDVTDRQSVDDAAATVRAELGGIDLVIFNAGTWEQLDAAGWDRELFDRQVQVNLLGLNNCLGAVLPGMIERGAGSIVGVASVAGYRGIAGGEAYGATKAAQINLLEGLRAATARRGIAVITVCPGFVRTALTAGNSFPMPFIIGADQAAESICRGLERGRQEIVFPLRMALVAKLARLLPVRAWTALLGRTGRS